MKRRIVDIKVLPGQPTDGSGRVCIHLFVQDKAGPIVETHVIHPKLDNNGNMVGLMTKPTRGRLACSATRTVDPVERNGVTSVTLRSDDPRAITCPKCKASRYYTEMMEQITKLEASR